jgi:hypothetical protein
MAASNVPLRNIVGAQFRANPGYQLVVFDRLPPEQQEALKELKNDPDFYGLLIPQPGSGRSAKSVSQDTALLLFTLSGPGTIPAYVQSKLGESCSRTLAELVLDGLLEIGNDGQFVSGSTAYDLIYENAPAAHSEGMLSHLSRSALQYAETLDVDESLRLSARLYLYNRVPLSSRWKQQFPSQEFVEDYLGITSGGATQRLLAPRWARMKVAPEFEGWFHWETRTQRHDELQSGHNYKLYVSPQPEFVQKAFRELAVVLAQSSAHHFKIGCDASGLLRPDKIVIYYYDFETLKHEASLISDRLAFCPAQGVPFTAAITEDGLLSWGIDPPRQQGVLAWQERESWRLWITNRLAVALLAAKKSSSSTLEPWRFALERIRLENIDTETWTPLASFGGRVVLER